MCSKHCILGYKSGIDLPQSGIVLLKQLLLKLIISQQPLHSQLTEVKITINRCKYNSDKSHKI